MQPSPRIAILGQKLLKSMALIIRSSAIHAAGCYTTSPIRANTRVVEYTGPRISKEIADERYQNLPVTYLFGIGDGSVVIDGHGTAMFINHSCDPNCETDEKKGRVWIKAIRDIAAGEELTYDYNLYDGDESEAFCNCGAKTCRGTMYSREEIRRRRRAAKAALAKTKGARDPGKKAQSGKKMVGRKPATGDRVQHTTAPGKQAGKQNRTRA
ncbi:MAG TPA: SET domain-containing protein-lysine N-methyltransferase [Acidisarcina sp.]|nr:SET domain-containing protein-lysine N-methyltransferase [Acidisarcina sp.]